MAGSGTDAGSNSAAPDKRRKMKLKHPLYPLKVTNFPLCDKRRKPNGVNIVALQLSVIGMESQKQALSSNFPYFMR